jgi:glucose/arabinose dehydrogenase
LSLDGTVLGELTFGEARDEWPGGLALRGDELIVAGHRFTGLNDQLWLRVMTLRGDVIWQKTFPDSRFGRASDIAVLPNGDLLVVGHRETNDKADGWIARFDRDGNPTWQRTYPSSER